MTRRFINQFAHQEAVNEVFVANGKQLRPNRNGNLYLQVELSDSTGSIGARMWNANEMPIQIVRKWGLYTRRGHDANLPGRGATDPEAHRESRSLPGKSPGFHASAGRGRRQTFRPAGRNAPRHERSGPGEPGRVLFARRALDGQAYDGPGRHQKSSRLSRRFAGSHRGPDGSSRARGALLSADRPRLIIDGRVSARPGQNRGIDLRARAGL